MNRAISLHRSQRAGGCEYESDRSNAVKILVKAGWIGTER